jgi:hypothetical protein
MSEMKQLRKNQRLPILRIIDRIFDFKISHLGGMFGEFFGEIFDRIAFNSQYAFALSLGNHPHPPSHCQSSYHSDNMTFR